jgi:hypothetical protein
MEQHVARLKEFLINCLDQVSEMRDCFIEMKSMLRLLFDAQLKIKCCLGYVEVAVIPVGARNIQVMETKPCTSFLGNNNS